MLFRSSVQAKEYSYNEILKIIYQLEEKYNFIDVFSIGKSVLGRPIPAIKIGVADNTVLYAGGFHGCERLTVTTLLLFAEEFAYSLANNIDYSLSNARNALFGKSIIIVPCVNPDGYEISLNGITTAGNRTELIKEYNGNNNIKLWNANARGVDINHNFNAGWDLCQKIEIEQGITGPAPRKYGGAHPESEPETQALTKLVRENNILQVLAIHSQGEEIYWQFGNNTPQKGFDLAKLYESASGYIAAQPEPSASYAGFKDWFIGEYSKPGFTLEIGMGENPLDPADLHSIYEKLKQLFLLSVALA